MSREDRGARVGHAHRTGARGFPRQHFGYGRGAWHFAGLLWQAVRDGLGPRTARRG